MATQAELAFADQVGRHFSRYYGTPPMTGRVAGWLLICDPPEPTIADVADALRASRTAVANAVDTMETWTLVRRTRAAGERADRVSLDPAFGVQNLDAPTEYVSLAVLARRGLETLGDAPPSRGARLRELVALAEWLAERLPALGDEWRARRQELQDAGELPPSHE